MCPGQTPEDSKPSGLLDLDTPIEFLPPQEKEKAPAHRVKHHLLQAMNALLEAANYSAGKQRQRYFVATTVLRAVFEGVRSVDPGTERKLLALRGPAEALLSALDTSPPFPISQRHVGDAKARFLALVIGQVAIHVLDEERRRSNQSGQVIESGFPYKKLLQVAESDSFVGDEQRATAIAGSLVMTLCFFFPSLARKTTTWEQAGTKTEQLARVVGYLMYKGGATAERVARAALLVVGADERTLKNYFSDQCVTHAEELYKTKSAAELFGD